MSAADTGPAAAEATQAIVDRFNAAWHAHDLPVALALISEGCVVEAIFTNPRSRFTVEHGQITAKLVYVKG